MKSPYLGWPQGARYQQSICNFQFVLPCALYRDSFGKEPGKLSQTIHRNV